MPLSKKQAVRLVKFVSLLKENRYPNCKTFAKILREVDIMDNIGIACNERTINRDVKILREDFGAPIDYDAERQGYFLRHHGWSFFFPILQDNQVMASVLGARVAENVFPDPVKSKIRSAVDDMLTTNNPDFLDVAYINSLIVGSGVKVAIDPDVFRKVFEAWQNQHVLEVNYRSYGHEAASRDIEPHVICFHEGAWYIKGYDLEKEARRVFAVHRIESADISDKMFEPDEDIISEVEEGHLFDYDQIADIKIWCSPEIAGYVLERNRPAEETVTANEDGSLVLEMPSAAKHEIIRWMLWERGRAKVLSPKSLAEEIAETALKIARIHSG